MLRRLKRGVDSAYQQQSEWIKGLSDEQLEAIVGTDQTGVWLRSLSDEALLRIATTGTLPARSLMPPV